MRDPDRDRFCPDCAVPRGAPHGSGCDVARCLWTGRQRIQCTNGLLAEVVHTLRDCRCADNRGLAQEVAYTFDLDDPDHDCGSDVWTGRWPGDEDAERLGLWCIWGPDIDLGPGWVACGADTEGARPDLNRLAELARWDRASGRWEAR